MIAVLAPCSVLGFRTGVYRKRPARCLGDNYPPCRDWKRILRNRP